MKFGSLFTGVGGFDLGFERAGMGCAWQVEQDKFCIEVLERRWPDTERYTDVREVGKHNLEAVELICGGFPCQDLSVAGKRAGLDGERSGLWFEFERIIAEMRPKWAVIENVPGLLSSANGSDFGVILKSLDELGYGVAWRVLDSQYFGVPQRRRRVFITASLGSLSAGQVLFEQNRLSGDIAKGKETWEGTATATLRGFGHGWQGQHNDTNAVMSYWDGGQVADTLDKSVLGKQQMMPEKRRLQAVIANWQSMNGKMDDDTAAPLRSEAEHSYQFLWEMSHPDDVVRDSGETAPTLQKRMGTGGNQVPCVGVRRLTPTECCRLQGFPDEWNDGVSDTQRYKQMGNAVTVNVAEWIGRRIQNIGSENSDFHTQ